MQSVYPGTYTFTKEQLAMLMEDTLFDASALYHKARAKPRHQRRLVAVDWQTSMQEAIMKALDALAFDATRPAERRSA